jgi:hypothetical protein
MLKRRAQRTNRDNELAIRMLVASSAINASRAARGTFEHLWDAEVKVFSQWGEDGILNYLFDLIGLSKPRIIEFGAGNFTECNSRFAAEYRNASVYAVDMRKDLVENVKSLDVFWKNSILPVCDFVTPDSAKKHQTIAECQFEGIDMISLDIDGNDYWVLQNLDFSNVQIVVCEYNPLYGPTTACAVERNDYFDRTKEHFSWLHYGMSLRAAIDLLSQSELIFIGTNRAGNNAFFIKKEFVKLIHFSLPAKDKLQEYVDWRVRESRDIDGNLSYLSRLDAIKAIADCKITNVTNSETYFVGQILENL